MLTYDRFMIEMIVVAKTRNLKLVMTMDQTLSRQKNPWMVGYFYSLCDLFRIENSKSFFSKNTVTHLVWEICNILMTLSQVSIVSFADVMKGQQGFSLFDYFGTGVSIPHPDSFESAIVFLFGVYLYTISISELSNDPSKTEQQKYDDTNIFDLKLQEFFIITFTTAKVELHEYFKNLQDNKFPKFLVVFNQLFRSTLGSLNFFGATFGTNHDVNFRISLAFLLFEREEYTRCESMLKQILEKESPGLQTKL